jgi:hypothetical protein
MKKALAVARRRAADPCPCLAKQSSRSAILSLADPAAWYRACLAAEAIEKSHRGADGSSTPRARQ